MRRYEWSVVHVKTGPSTTWETPFSVPRNRECLVHSAVRIDKLQTGDIRQSLMVMQQFECTWGFLFFPCVQSRKPWPCSGCGCALARSLPFPGLGCQKFNQLHLNHHCYFFFQGLIMSNQRVPMHWWTFRKVRSREWRISRIRFMHFCGERARSFMPLFAGTKPDNMTSWSSFQFSFRKSPCNLNLKAW